MRLGRRQRRGAGAGLRPAAALPARRLVAGFTSIAIAPVGDSSSRAIAGRRLPKVAAWSSLRAAWRSNLKPCASAACLQPVEMLVEIGDALVGIELHRLFKVAHRAPSSSAARQSDKPRDCAGQRLFLNLGHDDQSTSLLLAAALAPVQRRATAQPIDPKVQARIDRILKATPLIDGHNDLAEQLRENYGGKHRGPRQRHRPAAAEAADDRHGAASRRAASAGNSGRSTSPRTSPATRAIRDTLEQIDIVKRLIDAYPQRPRAGLHRRRRRPHPQGRQGRLADRHRGRPPDRRTASPRCANSTTSARAT